MQRTHHCGSLLPVSPFFVVVYLLFVYFCVCVCVLAALLRSFGRSNERRQYVYEVNAAFESEGH